MNASLRDLVHILDAETALYRSLLDTVRRERNAMLGSRLDEMNLAVAEKEELFQRLQSAEHRRLELVRQLEERYGWRPGDLTLNLLAGASAEPQRSELRRFRQELRSLVDRLREENRRSEVLWRHAGDLLKAFYGAAKGLAANGPVYQRGGRLLGAQLNGRLVRHEA